MKRKPDFDYEPAIDYKLASRIGRMARWVREDEDYLGILSFSEGIAAALVLDREDLLRKQCGTILKAIKRVGLQWTMAAIVAQEFGLDEY